MKHVSSLQCKELGTDIAFPCPSSAIKCRIMPILYAQAATGRNRGTGRDAGGLLRTPAEGFMMGG